MKIQFKIVESNREIENKILKALLPEIAKLMKNASQNISKEIKNLVVRAIENSPEYISLVSGSLKAEFGLPDPEQRLSELLNIWIKNIKVFFNPATISNSRIKSSFKLELIQSDFSDVLGSNAAILIDGLSGKSVYWLEWLSLAGDKTILKDYTVVYGPNKRSRTNLAIMRSQSGSKWRVPRICWNY